MYQEKIFRIVKIDDKQVELSVLEYGKEKDTYLLPTSNLLDFRKASEEEIDFYNKSKESMVSSIFIIAIWLLIN